MKRRYSVVIKLLVISFLAIIVLPYFTSAEQSDDALTRGGRFSINITGLPSTPYFVWLTRTSTMTGKAGDQPPLIVPFQSCIQQDPADGPYTIGSYEINNGNGRTIRDDIAPSTPEVSNTNYYALVTTDTDGRAVIMFQTSSSTATRTFSVKVENFRSAANSDILIERGLPSRIPTTVLKEPRVPTTEFLKTTSVIPEDSHSTATILLTTTPAPDLAPTPRAGSGPGFFMVTLLAVFLIGIWRDVFR